MVQLIVDHPTIAASIIVMLSVAANHEYELRLRPLFIPKSEIETLAATARRDHGADAAFVASILIDRAQIRIEPFEQGQWRRVLKYILKNQQNT